MRHCSESFGSREYSRSRYTDRSGNGGRSAIPEFPARSRLKSYSAIRYSTRSASDSELVSICSVRRLYASI